MSAQPQEIAAGTPSVAATLQAAYEAQRRAYAADPVPSYAQRVADLRTLRRFIVENREALLEAVNRDYGNRSRHETLFGELVPVLDGVKHALRHLRAWMRPQRRGVDLLLFPGARNRVLPQPLGIVGVIVPWNFPINLMFSPLISIFAAGNRALVKLSENSRHLAAFLLVALPKYFPPEKLAVFDESGGVGVEFSRLPVDHLLFTGSSQTGRAVMAAAAANLCPVTLELGGKSPALIDRDFPLRKAAERILFVKLLNAGQICTTVDYVFMPRARIEEFVKLAQQITAARYPDMASTDYTSIIDARAFARIKQVIEEARARGARVVQLLPGEAWDDTTRKITPHLVIEPPRIPSSCSGRSLDRCCRYSATTNWPRRWSSSTRGRGPWPSTHSATGARPSSTFWIMSCRAAYRSNDALWHVGQHDLPFGGVGASGMGHYHGKEGFLTFSKLRPVFYQAPVSGMRLLWPPFGALANWVLNFLTR